MTRFFQERLISGKEPKVSGPATSQPSDGLSEGGTSLCIGCNEVQQHLLHLLHPQEVLPVHIQEHIANCKPCQTFQSQLLMLDDLTRAQAPELPDSFQLSLHRRLKEKATSRALTTPSISGNEKASSSPRSRKWFRTVWAAAALVLIIGGALLFTSRWNITGEKHLTYHRLRLAIQSTGEYPEVLFDIDLPPGVHSLPATGAILGKDNLQWQSPLHPGINEFDLPLVASSKLGKVIVRLRAGKESWTGTVMLNGGRESQAFHSSTNNKDQQRLALMLDLDIETLGFAGGKK